MKRILTLLVAGLAFAATAQERPAEIDPNTKIQGGAHTEERTEAEKPPLSSPQTVRTPEKRDSGDADKDKAISERKPQEREREEASRGESKSAPQQ